ncbi:hypothetical protein BD289DRAFT_449067 [Coniella lustricola]|uniref:NodB homology domain-containing protein n=1 Tax=Coniella lustricola TaxID=2025994 RepID=A0A2T3ANG3_9PEZI|nr:hypothetical protein BD289DRAFT_449067 [Coniella lustricola]
MYNNSDQGLLPPNFTNDTRSQERFPPLDYLATLPRPSIGSVPFGQVITRCTVPGTIALTFDDGPWRYTSDLLDLLEREDARATFFVCGGNMNNEQLAWYGHPRLLRRMLAGGHQIGTHTYSHADLGTLDAHDTFTEMFLNEQAFVGVLGLLPTYFRPPYLSWSNVTLDVLTELGYHITSIDLDTMDWAGDYREAKRLFEQGLDENDPHLSGKLVLAHDIRLRTVYELVKFMIDKAKTRGYQLVTVGECLGDNRQNWYRNPYNGESWMKSPALIDSLKESGPPV